MAREIKATFKDGRKVTYTMDVYNLLTSDPDVLEVMDSETGEAIYQADSSATSRAGEKPSEQTATRGDEAKRIQAAEHLNPDNTRAAIAAMKYGPYNAPYWRRRWEREEAKQKREKVGRLDYSQIVAAATDYMMAYQDYKRVAADRRKSREEVDRAWMNQDKYSAVFWTVCVATGIPQAAAMAAARVEDRYYNWHDGTLCIDYIPCRSAG